MNGAGQNEKRSLNHSFHLLGKKSITASATASTKASSNWTREAAQPQYSLPPEASAAPSQEQHQRLRQSCVHDSAPAHQSTPIELNCFTSLLHGPNLQVFLSDPITNAGPAFFFPHLLCYGQPPFHEINRKTNSQLNPGLNFQRVPMQDYFVWICPPSPTSL